MSIDSIENLEKYMQHLFPLPRSLMGKGTEKSLEILNDIMDFDYTYFPTGYKADEWTVPKEWEVFNSELIIDNKNIADIKKNNLHVLNYSEKINIECSILDMKDYLFFNEALPHAIPYVTSYYEKNIGVCIKYEDYVQIKDKKALLNIDSSFSDGNLPIAEAYLPGTSSKEVILNSYLCHPSMANNELSGPLAMALIYEKLSKRKNKYSYRFLIAPESIGAIMYLSKNLKTIKENLEYGIVLTCLGGPVNKISYKDSPKTIRNSFSEFLKKDTNIDIREFDPNEGSNERHFTFPNVELPFGQFARTVYGQYKEYHNSLDNIEFADSNKILESANQIFELLINYENKENIKNTNYQQKINFLSSQNESFYKPTSNFGEPFLSKYNLYPKVNTDGASKMSKKSDTKKIIKFLSMCNGYNSIDYLQEELEVDNEFINTLIGNSLIKPI